LDFGIAKLLPESGTLIQRITQSGELLGTLVYMSPEQCNSQAADKRSDIFSLGSMLYETLCAKLPFRGNSPFETLNNILNENPAPIDRDLPDCLQMVLNKILAKDPDQRYQSMEEVAEDLQRIKDGAEVKISPFSKLTNANGIGKRQTLVLTATLVILIAVASAALVLMSQNQETENSARYEKVIAASPIKRKNHIEEQNQKQGKELEDEAKSFETKGMEYYQANEFSKAIEQYNEGLKFINLSYKPDQNGKIVWPEPIKKELVSLHFGIGYCNKKLGNYAELIREFDQATRFVDHKDDPMLTMMANHLSDLDSKLNGNLSLAEKLWISRIAINRKAIGDKASEELAYALQQLALIYNYQKNPIKERETYKELLRDYDQLHVTRPGALWRPLTTLHSFCISENNFGEASALKQRILKLRRGEDLDADLNISVWMDNSAKAQLGNKNFKLAEPWLKEAAEVYPADKDPIAKAEHERALGANYIDEGEYKKAQSSLQRALTRLKNLRGKESANSIEEQTRIAGDLARAFSLEKDKTPQQSSAK
ncbi:MAG: protein kinase, partial [Candidatus Obscuribacterales bacterium]|nr:protein kinase [Candidatus Obscuribacterales bacterium]